MNTALEKFKMALVVVEKYVQNENSQYQIIQQVSTTDIPDKVTLNWAETKSSSKNDAFALNKPELSNVTTKPLEIQSRVFRLQFSEKAIYELAALHEQHIAVMLTNSIDNIISLLREEYREISEDYSDVGIGTHFLKLGMANGELLREVSGGNYGMLTNEDPIYEVRLTSFYRPISPPDVEVKIKNEDYKTEAK